jgi:uncharacterized protein (DUF952 family)
MHLFHIATAADWESAKRSGSYTTSTLDRTLAEEGFIHAAYREQVPTVFGRHYRDAGRPLVLLTIDTDRLEPRWADERVGDEVYPHIHGPVNTTAVLRAMPLDDRGGTGSFFALFAREVAFRMVMAVLCMLLSVAGMVAGREIDPENGPLLGALAGLAVGGVLWWLAARRLRRREV